MSTIVDACLGKEAYNTSKQAQDVVNWLKRSADATSSLRVYKCPFCSKYHLGNSSRRR